ncbi:phosphoadenosine phosphosulfate reductase [Pannonibacter phragmitetus]|uniref:phosphoadenylyl-sulfate reductase n=1 Tax=Pannonibacter phragmitetus TaxID=121719 RepID=UPI00067BC141|nr:phosphoadenylyl-sulfate reductase [Pannonibacter phragmitetus]KND20123.1 phosphoadenosine phosphosulfate reductase [Pannonibacter phragmitetus]
MALTELSGLAFDPELGLGAEALAFARQYEGESPQTILRDAIRNHYVGRIALVSSFGADSAVLLHMVSEIDPSAPVIFVDTGKHFPQTLRYRDLLVDRLGLTGVLDVRPDPEALSAADPGGMLWMVDTDACCHARKVVPLATALKGFDAWISGRKRFQSSTRAALPVFEVEEGRVKVNPLASWTASDILAYAKEHDLPPHPLVAEGYPSIGCLPCTSKVAPGEDPRSGRWRGMDKTECGIHLSLGSSGL